MLLDLGIGSHGDLSTKLFDNHKTCYNSQWPLTGLAITLSTASVTFPIMSSVILLLLWWYYYVLPKHGQVSEILSDLRDWGRRWFADFNAAKTQLVSLDQSNKIGAVNVKMDGSVLEEKSSFKMLGLTFLHYLYC